MSARDPELVQRARGAGYRPESPGEHAEWCPEPERRRGRAWKVDETCSRCEGSGLVVTTRNFTVLCTACDGRGTNREDA